MAYEYKDVRRCKHHGLALSAGTTCLRCDGDAAEAERRERNTRRAMVAAVLVPILCALLLFLLLAPSAPPSQLVATDIVVHDRSSDLGVEPFGPKAPAVTSPETHAVLKEWGQQLARAEAEAGRKERAAQEAEANELRANRQAIWKNLGPTPAVPTYVSTPEPRPRVTYAPPVPQYSHHRYHAPPALTRPPVAFPRTVALPPQDPPLPDPSLPPPVAPGGNARDDISRLTVQPHIPDPPRQAITEGNPVTTSL